MADGSTFSGPELIRQTPAEFLAQALEAFDPDGRRVVINYPRGSRLHSQVLCDPTPEAIIVAVSAETATGPQEIFFRPDDMGGDPLRNAYAWRGDRRIARVDGLGPEAEGLITISDLNDAARAIAAARALTPKREPGRAARH